MKAVQSFLVLGVCLLAVGCVAPSQVMVNPQNGATADCSTWGFGWLGAPVALISHEQCKEKFKALGYLSIEEYKASGRTLPTSVQPAYFKVTSDPPGGNLWAGPNQESLKIIGKTPIAIKHPKGGQVWKAECYKVTMEGYKPSDCICKNLEAGDRVLSFSLSKQE